MREAAEALRTALERIRTRLQEGRYEAASIACTDFLNLAYHLERKTDLFIGEVLEAVCLQTARELQMYSVPRDVKDSLLEKITKNVDRLLAAYDVNDNVCDILVDIRYDITVFQFEVRLKYNQVKPSFR